MWSAIPSPNEDLEQHNNLFGLAARSKNDIWAVGTFGGEPLVLHWDGAKWSLVPGPRPQELGRFHAIVSVTQNEVLAVGDAHNDDRPVNALVARFTQFPCATPSSTTGTSTGDP